MSRGITEPIKKLVALTDRMREGDYTSDVEVEREDEIGSLPSPSDSLMGELREKSHMEKYISRSAAEMMQKTDALRVKMGERRRSRFCFPTSGLSSPRRSIRSRKRSSPK